MRASLLTSGCSVRTSTVSLMFSLARSHFLGFGLLAVRLFLRRRDNLRDGLGERCV